MNIWVDADACPAAIKDILYRAAQRAGIVLTLVANRPLRVPPSPWIRTLQVASGFDVADRRIIEAVGAGDLVITADIPLAAEVIARGAQVLEPRGQWIDADSVRERLSLRDFMATLRDSGIATGGPPPLSAADRQAFASRLDSLLARRPQKPGTPIA